MMKTLKNGPIPCQLLVAIAVGFVVFLAVGFLQSDRNHEVSRTDRAAIRVDQADIREDIQINRRSIDRLEAEVAELKVRLGLPVDAGQPKGK